VNTLLHWFTSPEWALAVKALLHTLWQGVLLAIALGLILRRTASPVVRHRLALAALVAVVLAGIVTWAMQNRAATVVNVSGSSVVAPVEGIERAMGDGQPAIVVTAFRQPEKTDSARWTAWLALVWLAGAALMLGRAGFQVAGAERLRRATRPLDDSRLEQLVAEAKRAVRLTRKIRVAVTDKLTSPAVVGVLVPTFILPLSLITTLSQEQLRFVLLHELAHIRRGDYFANLFQLFAEALLFFNPAVWWISHQVRREREACCDAVAIELSGAPVYYAKTLVQVAENALSPAPAAAPAFSDGREPSSLADRVQRLLVPGYRPALRLTWRAMLLALLVGGALLFLSAIGTRLTVAAVSAEPVGSGTTNLLDLASPQPDVAATNHTVPSAWTTNSPRISEARQNLVEKLGRIRINTVYFDNLELGDVVRYLSEESRKRDPEKRGVNFMLAADTPSRKESISMVKIRLGPPPMSDIPLAGLLDAIVKAADNPIKYSIEDHFVVFSFSTDKEAEPLYTRTFKVDTNAFYRALTERGGLKESDDATHFGQSIRTALAAIGVELQPPKAVFYGDRKGTLLVRATLKDLDAVEKLLQVLNETPPQVNIRATFVEVPAGANVYLGNLGSVAPPTSQNPPPSSAVQRAAGVASLTGILTEPQRKAVFEALKNNPDVTFLSTPEVTTLSGRQARIEMVDSMSVANGLTMVLTNNVTNMVYNVEQLDFGPKFDVIPQVSADNYTIQMTVTPSMKEFLGYDKSKTDDASPPLPKYRERKITTTAVVWDGQTLVLGNFSVETITMKPDGTGKAEVSNEKKRLFVFVTPTIIDPAGNRVHTEDEMPFARDAVPPQGK
jgi:beta-lactamase regulating signal transducer with metallopeptidase domain